MRPFVLLLACLLTYGASARGQTVPEHAPAAPAHPKPAPEHKPAPGAASHPSPPAAQHVPPRPHRPVAALPVKPAPAPVPPVPVPPAEAPAAGEKSPDAQKPEGTGAKLPRFASLRADEVNMRAGPGVRYRIEWVYKRRDLPVEIERQYDVWRYVRDADGVQGWMQQATLMGRRSFIVRGADATVRSEASDSGQAVAILKAGVVGRIRSCEAASAWCNVQAGSYRGYLRRDQFWGTLPGEAVGP